VIQPAEGTQSPCSPPTFLKTMIAVVAHKEKNELSVGGTPQYCFRRPDGYPAAEIPSAIGDLWRYCTIAYTAFQITDWLQ
jgi:hypothetical protein